MREGGLAEKWVQQNSEVQVVEKRKKHGVRSIFVTKDPAKGHDRSDQLSSENAPTSPIR